MNPTIVRPIEILLVEDNAADAMLTSESFDDAHIANRIHVVKDGLEAMQFLRREGAHTQAPRPDFVLLDLNIPKKDGRKVLAEIKADASLSRIPVIVLTSSRHERDVTAAYDHHANAYIQKPVDLAKFLDVVRATREYWFAIVTLPSSVENDGGP